MNKAAGSLTLSMLTVLFVALKLTGVITWSWWAVLAPTWIPIAIVIVVAVVVTLVAFYKGWQK